MLSPFYSYSTSTAENTNGSVGTNYGRSTMVAQPWYSLLARILVEKPLLLTPRNKILYLPFNQDKCHPFGKKLKLMSCRLSGRPSKIKEFHSQLKHEFILSFWRHGTLQRQFGTYWSKWQEFTCEQSVNPFHPSVKRSWIFS